MRLLPRSHAGQLALLLFIALFIAQAVAFVMFTGERARAARFAFQENILARTATLVRLMEDLPAASHERVLEAASTRLVRFTRDPEPVAGEAASRIETALSGGLAEALDLLEADVRAEVLREQFAHPWRRWAEEPRERFRERGGPRRRQPVSWVHVSVPLPDGSWLNVVAGPPPAPPPFGPAFFVSLLLSVLASGLVALLVGRRIGRPMRKLADAAERFGRGEAVQPLREEGPDEARRSARAFNRMRERLDRFVSDRTRMLAAISHDLRTPITSLRLRAELVEDAETRQKLVETVEEMQAMTEAALAFVSADAAREETRDVDLGALVESLVADLAELGYSAEVAEGQAPIVRCRPAELKRALRNVIENGVRYGGAVRISLEGDDAESRIVVDDDGAGIPDGELERVFEPFVRLERSRSRETGGVGLGLAIARGIMRGHGGDIRLANRPTGGLRAVLSLPRN